MLIAILLLVLVLGVSRVRHALESAGRIVLLVVGLLVLFALLPTLFSGSARGMHSVNAPGGAVLLVVLGHLALAILLVRRWWRRHPPSDAAARDEQRLRGRERVRLPPRGESFEEEP